MRNIFLVYIPPGNPEAMVHYEETIRQKVSSDRVYRHVDSGLRSRLMKIFSARPIAVWGSQDSPANRSKFERMAPGDEVLIIEGDIIKLLGKIAATTINPDLSRELWRSLKPGGSDRWDLIYFIANPQEIDLPFKDFCKLVGYASTYQLRGLTLVSQDRLDEFYSRFDDLYSILMKLKCRQPVYEIPQHDLLGHTVNEGLATELAAPQENLDEELPEETISDHVRMQWKLLNLGMKAGSRVWIPTSDQTKIRTNFKFDQFETDFAAGLDTQVRYVENIDVVWKEEFRIDAAFEIENTQQSTRGCSASRTSPWWLLIRFIHSSSLLLATNGLD